MLARIQSIGLSGLEGFPVWVEVDCSQGLPHWEMVGLPDAAVKESRERVRSAIKNSGYEYPVKRITINLAPADMRKESPIYDLAIAVALLEVTGQVHTGALQNAVLLGELSLNGNLCGVKGVLPMVIDAKERGVDMVVLPKENAKEAAYVEGIHILPVESLSDLAALLEQGEGFVYEPARQYAPELSDFHGADFMHIRGQESAKRAVEVAVAGGHNILFIGPPGAGKTMLAKAIPSILPPMQFEEALESTKIHSVSGELDQGILTERPFRSPHHTASTAAITGGGIKALPGEVSLAHNGVLFLDELPEFRRDTLEALRQPIEEGKVSVARVLAKSEYPARFMLVASMNPCPCGHYGDPKGQCRCTLPQIHRYLSKISGPLLDRIDLHIEVARPIYQEISDVRVAEPSADIRKRIQKAREIQKERYSGLGIWTNSQLTGEMFHTYCKLSNSGEQMLKTAFQSMGMSARSYKRILMVARTVADLQGSNDILDAHIAEAIQYRTLDRKYWGGK